MLGRFPEVYVQMVRDFTYSFVVKPTALYKAHPTISQLLVISPRTLCVNLSSLKLLGVDDSRQSTGVRVEMTATEHASIQRHTFPPSSDGSPPRINVDINNAADNTATEPFVFVDPTTGRVTGNLPLRLYILLTITHASRLVFRWWQFQSVVWAGKVQRIRLCQFWYRGRRWKRTCRHTH